MALYSHLKDFFYISSRQHYCIEQFFSNNYLNDINGITREFFLGLDYIIEFTSKTNCLEVRLGCLNGQESIVEIPYKAIAYSRGVIVGEVIPVNTFVIYLFIQKDQRSPVTVILSALALSDTLGAIVMSVPALVSYVQNYHHIYYDDTMPLAYVFYFNYPQCAVYNFLANIKHCFHLISVLITSLLCLIKTSALLFPMWSNRYLTSKVSALICLFILLFSLALFSPILKVAFYYENVNGMCCGNSLLTPYFKHTYMYMYLTSNICICLACLVVFACTIYISCKLTILRRNLPWTDNEVVQKRNRISTIIVVLICIIFLISELPYIILIVIYLLINLNGSYDAYALYDWVRPIADLVLLIGFSMNFVVYIVMSKQLRQKVWKGIRKKIKC